MNSISVDDKNEENIQKLIDINELPEFESVSSIASVERSRSKIKKSFQKPKDRWYQNYSVADTYVPSADITFAASVEKKVEKKPVEYEVGEEVPALAAINYRQGAFGLDIRPKVFDKLTNSWTLLDSGSSVTCTPRLPSDSEDHNFKLKAVNGESIATYGMREVSLQIGRKKYTIDAVITEIPHVIFGWDLFKKYALGFEWNSFGDLLVTTKKLVFHHFYATLRYPTYQYLKFKR